MTMAPLHASWVALALCYAGMAALALAMDRHHEQVTGQGDVPGPRRQALRWGGGLLLALALAACAAAWGLTVGLVAWCGFLTAGGLAVAWLLPYAPRQAAVAALAALLLGLGGGGMAWALAAL